MLELPLALASFLLYRSTRFIMRHLIVLNSRLNRRRAHQWNLLSAETFQLPLALPAIMTAGPRWNPHAIIAGAGPFSVKQSVSVDLEPVLCSAKSWTLVFYTFPDQRTVAHIGALDGPFPQTWRSLALAPGKYTIALRYYHWSETIGLPEIQADGESVISFQSVSHRNNDFYLDLIKRRSGFYLGMHYYMYTLLRRQALVSPGFVEREFLPMGNPESRFRYGALEQGEAIRIELAPTLLANHDVYFTWYTRDSFPVRWYQIIEGRHLTEPALENGFYLIRIHRKAATGADAAEAAIDIQMVPKQ